MSAWDVDANGYVDLVKLTAANLPKLTITSTDVGNLDNIDVGINTRGSGKFTTLFANNTATFEAAVTMTAANKDVTFSPTGTGLVKVEPAAALSLKSTASTVTITSFTTGNMDGIAIYISIWRTIKCCLL